METCETEPDENLLQCANAQSNRRVWRDAHRSNGSMIGDNGLQTSWDSSRGQAGSHGVLTNFVGGKRGEEIADGEIADRVSEVLPLYDQVWSGTAAQYSGEALRMGWPTYPFTRGSYLCYRPGQARWNGTEGDRVGNLHFCGEHTSIDNQGFMEGACETGIRAAAEILSDLGLANA